jgi:hypothetical protein
MKKFGFIVFAVCIVVGLAFANFFNVGRITGQLFNFKVDIGDRVTGSGNAATERRDAAGFSEVEVSGAFQVEIVAGKDFSVEVQADDNILPLIQTKVNGDTLQIELEQSVKSKSAMIVRISAPNIERVQSSGAAKIDASGIKNEQFNIETSGASKVVVNGETVKLDIEVSGASNVDAEQLRAAQANVGASGASKVTVNAANELHADASGASKILYTGEPTTVNKGESGGSSIRKK